MKLLVQPAASIPIVALSIKRDTLAQIKPTTLKKPFPEKDRVNINEKYKSTKPSIILTQNPSTFTAHQEAIVSYI